MTVSLFKSAFAGCMLALLSACGGGGPATDTLTPPAFASTVTASPAPQPAVAQGCASAECAPVIDGLAEEFRSRAQRGKPAAHADEGAAPAYPQVAANAELGPPPPAPEAFGAEGR